MTLFGAKAQSFFGLALVGISLLASACSEDVRPRFANVPQDWFNAPVFLAINGWLGHRPTTNVTTFSLTSGLASETAVAAGNAEIGLASPIVLLRDPSSAAKIAILGCYMQSGEVLGIVSRQLDTIDSPVGYVTGTISELFLSLFLQSRGVQTQMSEGGIKSIALLPPNLVPAMRVAPAVGTPSINSFSAWEPYLSRAADQYSAHIIRVPNLYTMHVCLIVNKAAYAKNSAAIDAFVAEVRLASAFLTTNPVAGRRQTEEVMGLETGQLEKTWNFVNFTFAGDQVALSEILKMEVDALSKAHMLGEAVNPASFILR